MSLCKSTLLLMTRILKSKLQKFSANICTIHNIVLSLHTQKKTIGAVVQLVRIHACHAWGREFESRPHRIEKRLCQNRHSLNYILSQNLSLLFPCYAAARRNCSRCYFERLNLRNSTPSRRNRLVFRYFERTTVGLSKHGCHSHYKDCVFSRNILEFHPKKQTFISFYYR